jgi:HSP20 family protein
MTLSVKGSAGRSQRHPLHDAESVQAELNRLAQSVFGGKAGQGAWMPAADVIETTGAYTVEIELPGVRRDDVDVDLNGNELVVTGEVKERQREGLFRHRTRRVGEFELRVTLPGHLEEAGAEASLAYGVLRVYVPKAEGTTTNRITVREASDGRP